MEKLINDFSVGLFFWQTLLFLVLVFFLRKFAWKPILEAVEGREKGIKKALDAADKAKADMEALNADNERILTEAKAERDSLLKEAREMKERIISEAKEKANLEADKVMDNAKEQINNEKQKAVTELKNHVASLSIEIAEKVLKNELKDAERQKELVGASLREVDLN